MFWKIELAKLDKKTQETSIRPCIGIFLYHYIKTNNNIYVPIYWYTVYMHVNMYIVLYVLKETAERFAYIILFNGMNDVSDRTI